MAVKVKGVSYSTQHSESPLKYCILELEGQFWPEDFIAENGFDFQTAESAEVYRVSATKLTKDTTHFYEVEKVSEIRECNVGLDYDIPSDDL